MQQQKLRRRVNVIRSFNFILRNDKKKDKNTPMFLNKDDGGADECKGFCVWQNRASKVTPIKT